MNRIVRDLIFLGIGAAVGAVSSYFVLRRQYEKEIEEETSEMRDFARKQIAQYKQEKDIAEDYAKKLEAAVVEDDDTEEKINPDMDEYEDEAAKYGSPSEGPTQDIYLISQEQYDDEMTHYAKINLIHYALDGTVTTDDGEEIVDDPRSSVGDCIDEMNSHGAWRICFVRNDRRSEDFAINNILGSYIPD